MNIEHVAAYVITPLLMLIIGVFNLYLNSKFRTLENNNTVSFKKINKLEESAAELKDNYVGRFEEVNNNLNENKIEVLNALHKIDLCVTKISNKVDEQAKFCEAVQRNKKG